METTRPAAARAAARGLSVLSILLLALTGLAGATTPAPRGDLTDRSGNPRIGDWGVDLAGRDLGVPPSQDFFRHANGTWLEEFEIPADLSSYGSFTQLFLDAEEQVHAIIEEAASADAPEGSLARKIGDLYADYVDAEALDAQGLAPIEPDLALARSVRTHEDVARLLGEWDRTGGTTPFNWYVDQDANDPTRYLVQFVQSGLGLPDRDYYLDEENERFAQARDVYRAYLPKMLAFAAVDDPEGAAQRIWDLEYRLAEAHWSSVESRDLEKTTNETTRAELEALAPGLPWGVYLDAAGIGDQTVFNVAQPSAFAGMAEVFADTPVPTWREWLAYRRVRNASAFLPRAVDDTQFEFTSALSGAQSQRDRWKRGVQLINGTLGEAVGQLYVERHFPPEAKERIDELVGNLLAAFAMRIETLDWMSEETKVAARDKLAKFTVKVGYPEEWRDYDDLRIVRGGLLGNVRRAQEFASAYERSKLGGPVDRKEWFLSPQTVNAYYNPNMNEIVFPAAILQPPFFDPWADDAVNYGAIGAVIGHEIGHGFDDQGRKVDGDGALRDWWTPEDDARFREKADRLVAQYSAFEPIEGMHVDGELTLGENIGDLGGLEVAYHAWKLSLDGEEPPVVDGLTGDQRFFLGFAQIWRGKARDELMVQLLAADPHSPDEFRVNGTLRNVDAWYDAFGVGPGHAMWLAPDERVHIW